MAFRFGCSQGLLRVVYSEEKVGGNVKIACNFCNIGCSGVALICFPKTYDPKADP